MIRAVLPESTREVPDARRQGTGPAMSMFAPAERAQHRPRVGIDLASLESAAGAAVAAQPGTGPSVHEYACKAVHKNARNAALISGMAGGVRACDSGLSPAKAAVTSVGPCIYLIPAGHAGGYTMRGKSRPALYRVAITW